MTMKTTRTITARLPTTAAHQKALPALLQHQPQASDRFQAALRTSLLQTARKMTKTPTQTPKSLVPLCNAQTPCLQEGVHGAVDVADIAGRARVRCSVTCCG